MHGNIERQMESFLSLPPATQKVYALGNRISNHEKIKGKEMA